MQTTSRPRSADVKDMAAGADHSLILLHDGSLRAFGLAYACDDTPAYGEGPFSAIAAGWYHSLALVV